MPYAEKTKVPVMRTRMEIERMLTQNGVTTKATLEEPGRAVVMFEKDGRRIRFEMKLPVLDAPPHAEARTRRHGKKSALEQWDQACRERWRALLLALKSKFVSIATGIETFEEAFLAHILIFSPQSGWVRVGELVLPQVAESYRIGAPLRPLLGPGPRPGGTNE